MSRTAVLEGLSSEQVCEVAGVTYRQLDHWTRLGYVSPSVRAAYGSGTVRRWSRADAELVARIARGLLEGLTLRAAAARAQMATAS